MKPQAFFNRRHFLQLMANCWIPSAFGEGIKSQAESAIDATGFVGILQKSDRLYINGETMSDSPGMHIEIDGQGVDPDMVRSGQMASLIAKKSERDWTTQKISILSEVIGAIEKIDSPFLRVLGQTIRVNDEAQLQGLAPGDQVAVSGLRRPDQTIEASLITKSAQENEQLVGLLTTNNFGDFFIVNQKISGVDGDLVGERIVVQGSRQEDVFIATFIGLDPAFVIMRAPHVSIETYLSRNEGQWITPDGLKLIDAPLGAIVKNNVPAIIIGDRAATGSIRVREIRMAGAEEP